MCCRNAWLGGTAGCLGSTCLGYGALARGVNAGSGEELRTAGAMDVVHTPTVCAEYRPVCNPDHKPTPPSTTVVRSDLCTNYSIQTQPGLGSIHTRGLTHSLAEPPQITSMEIHQLGQGYWRECLSDAGPLALVGKAHSLHNCPGSTDILVVDVHSDIGELVLCSPSSINPSHSSFFS